MTERPAAAARPRFELVDVARGTAFAAMVVYHATWFAHDRGLVDVAIGAGLGWRLFQKAIAGTFYLLVGVSLALAHRDGVRAGPAARRLGILAGAAAIVTVASAVLDARALVTYGILHNIAVCSVFGLAAIAVTGTGVAARWGYVGLGLGLIALDMAVASPALDAPWVRWLGLGTGAPRRTFDFQPLLPWLGVVVIGVAAGGWLGGAGEIGRWRARGPALGFVARCGRNSLFLYLAHVPVLVVAVEIAAWLRGA